MQGGLSGVGKGVGRGGLQKGGVSSNIQLATDVAAALTAHYLLSSLMKASARVQLQQHLQQQQLQPLMAEGMEGKGDNCLPFASLLRFFRDSYLIFFCSLYLPLPSPSLLHLIRSWL